MLPLFARPPIDACREAFWPTLLDYLKHHGGEPNQGPYRHFLHTLRAALFRSRRCARSPSLSVTPGRAIVTIRYVRRWYADHSREVNAILPRLASRHQNIKA